MPTFASSTLALTIALDSYLHAICATNPNPTPTKQQRSKTDRIAIFVGTFAVLARRGITTIALYHAILVFYFPSLISPENTPAKPKLCPRPWNLAEDLFTWSTITTLSLLCSFLGAFIRLSAFGGLGKYFTFQLAAPDRLVTTGIYRFMQHPSYTGQILVTCPLLALILRSDAAAACFLDEKLFQILLELRWVALPVAVVVVGVVLTIRVRDEEAMLKEKFGDEWVEWNRRTKRFIPFVF